MKVGHVPTNISHERDGQALIVRKRHDDQGKVVRWVTDPRAEANGNAVAAEGQSRRHGRLRLADAVVDEAQDARYVLCCMDVSVGQSDVANARRDCEHGTQRRCEPDAGDD